MVASAALVGKWQIVESGTWPRDHLDLCGPAYLRIDADGSGEMAFGALIASVDGGFTSTGVDFDWDGPMKAIRSPAPAGPICAMTAASKAKSLMTIATTHPSSPNRGLFQQPANAVVA